MLPRIRVEYDGKPSFILFNQSHQVENVPEQHPPARNIAALLDELFLVLYDPKEIVKLKLPQMHYCQQVPMRLRRLPKSFFIAPVGIAGGHVTSQVRHSPNEAQVLLCPATTNKHLPPGKCRVKSSLGSAAAPAHHFEYCCQTKSIQSSNGTPNGTLVVPDPKNNFVISNNHISFIEGTRHQYDARMYASIEVTATTLKYQKTLQLPPPQSNTSNKSPPGPFLSHASWAPPPPSNGASWEGSGPTHYPQLHPNQSSAWQLNYQRGMGPGMATPYESSPSESETELNDASPDKTAGNTLQSADYLDLEGFDSAVEYAPSSTLDLYSSIYQIGQPVPSHVEQVSSFVPYLGKAIVAEYAGGFTQPSLDQLVTSKDPSVQADHLVVDCDQLTVSSTPTPYHNPAIVSPPFGASNSANIWNPNSWN